mgnify:CR=1 FL=1|nr:MAG TPA: hypothetical protein [Caudoviricetes sp.]
MRASTIFPCDVKETYEALTFKLPVRVEAGGTNNKQYYKYYGVKI